MSLSNEYTDITYRSEIKTFLDEYFKLPNKQHEQNFLNTILSIYDYSLNNICFTRRYPFSKEYKYEISLYFSNKWTYPIFTEIKNLLINKFYLIPNLNEYNYFVGQSQYPDSPEQNIFCEILNRNTKTLSILYIFSINKILYEIFNVYNNNYKKMIEENNEYNNFIDKFDYLLTINNKQNKMKFIVNCIEIYLLSYNSEKRFLYSDYITIYKSLESYLNNLYDIEKTYKIKTIEKKPVEKKPVEKKPVEKKPVVKKSKKKSIPKPVRIIVWNNHFGDAGKAKCLCCKNTDITPFNFSCGHIISEFNGGAIKPDNLKPICLSCNSSMSTKNMDEFIEEYGL